MRIAIIENNKVVNVIVGEIGVVQDLFELVCLESEETGVAWIGARFNGKKFEPPMLYPSWTWDEKAFQYNPPKPKPKGDYFWSEADKDWLVMPEPEPELEVELEPEPKLEITSESKQVSEITEA